MRFAHSADALSRSTTGGEGLVKGRRASRRGGQDHEVMWERDPSSLDDCLGEAWEREDAWGSRQSSQCAQGSHAVFETTECSEVRLSQETAGGTES